METQFDAFILAAGFGTRLRPLTHHRPKPLVPVCGVPMLAYALALCHRHGLDEVVVNAHHLAEQLRPWEGQREGVRVTLSTEHPEILGTAGGLKQVAERLAPTFVVVNGDVLTDVDLDALRKAVPSGGGAMALRPRGADRYGVVAADASGTVVELVDEARATPVGAVERTTHFTGIHALARSTLDLVPKGYACVIRTVYQVLVPERRVRALRHEGLWLDIGDPRAYHDANLAVLHKEVTPPLDPFARAAWSRSGTATTGRSHVRSGATVDGDAWIGHSVELGARTHIRDSIVGDHARLAAGTEITRCIVWDGVEVPPGRYVDAILHDGGVLDLG